MALPNGDLITTVFDPQMAYPVDKRMQVDTLNSRDSMSMFIRWEGMEVYVLENSKKYILQGGRSNEYWKENGTGSGTGGTTFVGQFETADLLPTTGRSAGDYAFVGTGDDFVQYNWDNISGQWVMAEGQTDMASEFFHIGYKTPIRRPVIFPLFPKDVLVQESGDFVFAPETAVARFIFTGEVTAIRGIETAAADIEIKLVNRTGSDIPLRDKASGIPSDSGFDFGGTDYTWVNGSEITLKGNGTYWQLAPNNQIAFSDHLDSVNAEVSIGSDGLRVITGVNDTFTGQIVSFKEINYTPALMDGVVFTSINGIAVKRFVEYINYTMFGAKGDGVNDDTVQIKLAHQISNILNIPVINEEGEYWLNSPDNIPIKTNTSWGKTIFHINESNHSNINSWFVVERSESPVNITLSSGDKTSFLSKFKKGVKQISELSAYKNHFFIVFDANDQVNRLGGSGGSYPKLEMFKILDDGIFVGDILFELSDYTSLTAYRLEKEYLRIDGGSFNLSNTDNTSMFNQYIYSGFRVNRNKVKINNQSIYVDGTPIAMSFFDLGFYYPNNTCDFYLSETLLPPRILRDSGTYSIGGRQVMGFNITDLISNAGELSWGAMGTHNIKDLRIRRSNLNRIDVHFNACNIDIETCNAQLIEINGGGLLRIAKSKVNGNRLVGFRNDYGATWDGDIEITDCDHVIDSAVDCETIRMTNTIFNFDYNYHLQKGRRITISNLNIIYTSDNTATYEILRMPIDAQMNGDRIGFPSRIDVRNVKVKGRDLGVILLNITDTIDWVLESPGSVKDNIINPNSVLTYENVDADVAKTTQQTIFMGTAWNDANDEYSLYPKIDIINCGEVNLQLRDNIADLRLVGSNLNSLRIGSGTTTSDVWKGNLTVEKSKIKPRGTFNLPLNQRGILFVNSEFDIPYTTNTDTEVTTASTFSSRYGNLLTVNTHLLGTHLNSKFTKSAITFLESLSVVILKDYWDRLNLSSGIESYLINRTWGTTAERPPIDRIWVNFKYFNTTTGFQEYWNGTEWKQFTAPDATEFVKGIALIASQAAVDGGAAGDTIVTPSKLAASSRIVKMHGNNLSTADGTTIIGQNITGAITPTVNNNTGTGWPTSNGDARTFVGASKDRTWSLYKDRDSNDLYVQRYDVDGVGQGWVKITPSNASTTQRGIIEQATDEEIKTGTDTERSVDPKGLKDNYLSFTERSITSTGTVAITPLTYNIKQEKISFTGAGTVTLNGFSDVITDRTLILINKTGNDLTIANGASVTVPFSGAFVIPNNQSARFQVFSNLILKEL